MLIAQIQANDKLDVFNEQYLHELFIAELPVQNQRTITEQLFDFFKAAKVFLVPRSRLIANRSR